MPAQTRDASDIAERIDYVQDLTDIDGLYQSPIDLNIKDRVDIDLPDLEWENYEKAPTKMKISNNGHTVLISGSWSENERPFLTSGPLREYYIFSQMHFHWGKSNVEGSEHTVEDRSYPLEMHVVHFKADYDNQQDAMERKDGLVVAVYIFKVQAVDNGRIAPLTDQLPYVIDPYTSIRSDPFPIDELFDPFEDNYFMYWGSVTTESCTHRVLWLICREPVGISERQLAAFRALQSECGALMRSNTNLVQPLNNRNLFLVNGRKPLDRTLLPISPTSLVPARTLISTPLTESASDYWPFQFTTDNTRLLSPINLTDAEERHFAPLIHTNLFKPKSSALMKNSGKSVEISLTGRLPILEGGPLKGTYKFAALHFHWSSIDNYGSEHTINGKSFAAESHIVYIHVKCTDVDAARKVEGGLVVVANMYQISMRDNEDLNPIVDNLQHVMYPDRQIEIPSTCFTIFRINGDSGYYTYPGSLTTGEKSKTVAWIVYPEPIQLSSSQLREFRTIKDEDHQSLICNRRELQRTNDRQIFFAI